MRQAHRNIVKGYSAARLLEICQYNAKKYNETWYVLGTSGMAANARGRKGYEQFPALAIDANGEWSKA